MANRVREMSKEKREGGVGEAESERRKDEGEAILVFPLPERQTQRII